MSRGAIKELTRASSAHFVNLIKDVPASEKKEIVKIYQKCVTILGGDY